MLLPDSLKQFIETRWLDRGHNPYKLLTRCPLCNSSDLRQLFAKWDYDHLECQGCDLVFIAQEPLQEFLDDLYENFEYFSAKIRLIEKPRLERGEDFNFTMNVDKWYKSIVDQVLRWQQKGIWLDVGGGTGRFLRFIKSYAPKFETRLCESNTLAGQLAERYCATTTISWEELESLDGAFQVISCIAVFEHISDSVEFMQRLGRLLTPGGVLYMTMPRLGRLARHVSRSTLYDIAPPMHLRFFSDKSLRYLESRLNGTLRLCKLHQTHGKTFQLGHFFRPEWYQFVDVVPEAEGEIPSKIVMASPSTLWERGIFRLLALIDWLVAPLTRALDGQRVLHAIWQKPV